MPYRIAPSSRSLLSPSCNNFSWGDNQRISARCRCAAPSSCSPPRRSRARAAASSLPSHDMPARELYPAHDRLPRLAPHTGAPSNPHTDRFAPLGRSAVPKSPAENFPRSLPTPPSPAPHLMPRWNGSEPAGDIGEEPVRQSRRPTTLARPLTPAAWRPPLGVQAT
eukprot:scaffold133313_cov94-Phaeocystis_antarctica.AAC.2